MFTYPIRTVVISNNTITNNGGSGVLFALSTNEALPTVADDLTLTQNTISNNAKSYGPFLRGGICLQGGQANGQGHLTVTENTVDDNGGFGLCKHPFDGYNAAAHRLRQRLLRERARRQRVVALRGTWSRSGLRFA